MPTKKVNINKPFYQQMLLLMMAFFILLTPCSVKSQLKNMVGIPTQTEYNTLNKTSNELSIQSADTCLLTNESKIEESSLINSSQTLNVIPIFLVAFSFVCLITLRNHQQKTTSRYEKLSILPALPLFMQYRQLII